MRSKEGKVIRCIHRYKGLYGNYVPRFRKTRINGKWYFVTDYQCQIKGCNHWRLARFKYKLTKKEEGKDEP